MSSPRRQIEVALRIRTDLAQAVADVDAVTSSITDVGKAAASTNRALDKLDGKALSETARAAEDVGKGIQTAGESAQDATARIRAMVAASLEQQRALEAYVATEVAAADASRQSGAAAATQATQVNQMAEAANQSQAAVTQQIRSIGELSERIERGASSFEQLAETERLMDQQMRAGLLTEQEQSDMLALLDRQEKALLVTQERETRQMQALLRTYDPSSAALKRLAQDEARLKAAVDAGRISREQYNRAMVALQASRAEWDQVSQGVERAGRSILTTTDAARSLSTVVSSIAVGNISGAGDALLRLSSRGAVGFGVMGLAIGGAAAALAVLVAGIIRAQQADDELVRALESTGRAAGITESDVYTLGRGIDASSGQIGKGREALLSLISAGEASGDTLAKLAEAAVLTSELTGRSVQDVTRELQKLLTDPTKAAEELNRQYHFLTAADYEHVQALQEQGRVAEAAMLALNLYTTAQRDRLDEVIERQGLAVRLWKSVREAAKGALRDLQDSLSFDAGSDAEQLARIPKLREVLQREIGDAMSHGWNTTQLEKDLKRLDKQEEELQAKIIADREAAAKKGEEAQLTVDAIAAQGRQAAALGQDRAIAKARELKALEEDIRKLRDGKITQVDGLSVDDVEKKRRAQIEDRYREKPQVNRDAERDAREQERFVEQLERQAAVLGKTREETLQYELAERQLTGTLRERAQAAAQVIGDGERTRQAEADAKQLAEIQTQYLRAIGQSAPAAEAELEQRYAELLQRLVARGDAAGQEIVRKLFTATGARSQLEELQAEVSRSNQNIQREEERLNTQRSAGLIGPMDMQRKLLELREKEIADLQRIIPLVKAQADVLKDPAILEQVKDLELQLEVLQHRSSELGQTFRESFTGGLGDAIADIATRANTLKGAVVALIQDVARAMAQLAAQRLAEGIVAAAGYAAGGWTGSGDMYEPAGTVHRGEYVQPQRVMREPGAIAFMEDFRRSGMRAIDDWRSYAEGGLVLTGPSLSSQAAQLAAPGGAAARGGASGMVVGLEDGLVLRELRSDDGVDVMVRNMSRNPGKFRSALGV